MRNLQIIDNSNHFVIISGAGYRQKLGNISGNVFKDANYKPNIGASCGFELARNGYGVLLLSRSKGKLENIKKSVDELYPDNALDFRTMDLLNEQEVRKLKHYIPAGKTVHLVHCMGLSAGSYKLPDDNPYLPIEKTPLELPELEYEAVVKSLLLLVQILLPIFKRQSDSRIVVVSSMSGIRSFPLGYSHTSAKAGLHHATRALTMELNKRNVYVTEINPGIVNTGLYDPPAVRKAVVDVGKAYGYNYKLDNFPQMNPDEIAKAVHFTISADSHVLQINIVPKGQYPNLGA